MVFVDVSGFTTMSERLARHGKVGAEEVTDVIGDTFAVLLAEAYAYGGRLLKFGGDAMLLFFSEEGHPHRATRAAHAMRAALHRVGTFTTTAGRVTLRMSVGAHTGAFHFFLVGGSHRELIVAGPAATETVTMESAASAGQILLSPALAAQLPRANRGRPLGPGVLLAGTPPESERLDVLPHATTVDLEPFVPVALRETVLAGEVEPEHRSVTVVFVHYGGFDDLVRNDPDDAADALDALVRVVQGAADAHGIAFLATDVAADGGKIILTAGAPVVTGADEEQSLLAVRELVAAGERLPLHVGVHTGPVFAGAIGPPYRRTYTVMGDAVNLAARLMARAAPGEIVTTPAVLDGSRTIFETRELEPFLVKGKKRPITAFAVGEPKGSRATVAEAGLPLLGRDEELATLMSAWDAVRTGDGRVVEISAGPGMGKSRLLEELLVRVGEARVIRAECRVYQSATPYFPFRALLRSAFGLETLHHDAAVEALERLVEARSPSLHPWLSLIATPLDLDVAPSPQVEALDEQFRRARLEESVAALIGEVADRPTVVVVEDTHWMDEASRELLARVTPALRSSPWLVVLSRRPGEDGYVVSDESGVVRIALQPLGPESVTSLIHAATESAPLMPQQERELAERAAGSPLFLIELLDALRRGEDVDSLPSSVEGLIHARIDTLSTADRRRLRALSVLGKGFRVEHASATLGVDTISQIRAALRPLVEFISVDRSGWVAFRHALIRDAAYEGLPYRRRRELHARVGDSIFRASGGQPDEQAELLAVHYWHAGRWGEAWAFSRVAGDRAREVYANVEAASFYERALSAAQRLQAPDREQQAVVATRLAEAREFAGVFDAALDAVRRATSLTDDDPVALARLQERRARILMRTGSFLSAYRATARGYRLVEDRAGSAASTTRSSLSAVAASIRLLQGRPNDALSLARRAVEQAESTGEPAELALAYSLLDDVLVDLGRGHEAVHAERAVALFASVGRLQGVGSVENSTGVRAYAEGRWDDAVAAYARAEDAYLRAGDEAQAATVAGNIAEVLVSQGRLEEAEPVLRRTMRLLRAHGALAPALFSEIQLGRSHLARGQLDEAVSWLSRTREEAIDGGIGALALEAGVCLADALTRAGDPSSALRILDEDQARMGDYAVYFGASLARARAGALAALGRLAEAAATIESGLSSAHEHGALFEEAQLLQLRGALALEGSADAAEALQEAARLLQHLGVRSGALAQPGIVRRPSRLE